MYLPQVHSSYLQYLEYLLREEATKKAEELFGALDVDGDGALTSVMVDHISKYPLPPMGNGGQDDTISSNID